MNKTDLDHFDYMNYLSEQDSLFESSLSKTEVVSEIDTAALADKAKQILITHMNKISKSIQDMWNKFSAHMTDKNDQFILDRYKKYLDNGSFRMAVPTDSLKPNQEGMNKVINIQIPAFTGDDNFLASLDDKDKFISDHVKDLMDTTGNKLSMQDVAKSLVTNKAKKDEVVDGQLIGVCVQAVKNNKTLIDGIQKKIDTYNTAEKTIESMINASKSVNTPEPTEASQPANNTTTTAKKVGESAIYEGEGTTANGNNPNPAPVSNAPTSNTNDSKSEKDPEDTYRNADPNAASNQKANKQLQSRINNYISIATQILSAEMGAVHVYHDTCMTLITQYGKVQAKEAGDTGNTKPNEENNNNNNTEQQTTATVNTVKTGQ